MEDTRLKMLVCFPWFSASSEGGMKARGFASSCSFLEEALKCQRLGVLCAGRGCSALCPSEFMHSFDKRPASNPAHSSRVGRREGGQRSPGTPHHLGSMGYPLVPQKTRSAPTTAEYIRKETFSATLWTNFISHGLNDYGIISASGGVLI